MNAEDQETVDWPGCIPVVVFALVGSWWSSLFGFGAAGCLLLVVLLGTIWFSVLNRKSRILKSALFGIIMVVWNVVENDRDIFFDSDLYTLVLPLLLGFPLVVAVIAQVVVGRCRRR